MFNLFKRKPFKWPNKPKGTYLEQEYWNSKSIGYRPKFPIVVIDFNDGGSIKVYWLFRSDGASCFGQTVPL